MFPEVDASHYAPSCQFYNKEFQAILRKILVCYQLMLEDRVELKNNENAIRDELFKSYLNDNKVREALDIMHYLFHREVPEDHSMGRTDIRVSPLCSIGRDTSAYYVIECKRLDGSAPCGTSGLNAKYITNGICRFVSNIYSTHNQTSGMIGFVVQPINISQNIDSINQLLRNMFTEANTIQELEYLEIEPQFKFSYCSRHIPEGNSIVIYHLMLDFSQNILSQDGDSSSST